MAVRECAKTFLPGEAAWQPTLAVDEIGRGVLYVAHQIREGDGRFQADQDMGMVGHTMDGQELLLPFGDDAAYVFMKLLLVRLLDQILSASTAKTTWR